MLCACHDPATFFAPDRAERRPKVQALRQRRPHRSKDSNESRCWLRAGAGGVERHGGRARCARLAERRPGAGYQLCRVDAV